ncbi:unnamed protein product [Parnassius apollo]|uniref:(apollo) hypothetical protein n=1 Tax=Parnassius apollo TaxID=110799 RepID=A0A8S3WMB4_PARAO|nr:unnamed protein product [Parnassius apollo]
MRPHKPANVDAAVNTPVLVDSNNGGTVAQELEQEQIRSTLDEAILENAQYASRKSTATSPHSLQQAESGYREGSEPNAGDLFGRQPGPLRDGLNSLWRRTGSLPYYRRQTFHGLTHYWTK